MTRINHCLKFAASLLLLALSVTTHASGFESFSAERLAALNAEEKPILVEVYADWCSTCRRQSPILDELLSDAEFNDLSGLKLDWDAQREEATELGAPRQSTLILFAGGQQIDLSVAETNPDRLREFLRQAIN
jgi:thioredoxin 1